MKQYFQNDLLKISIYLQTKSSIPTISYTQFLMLLKVVIFFTYQILILEADFIQFLYTILTLILNKIQII
jgi:hypothetical protein